MARTSFTLTSPPIVLSKQLPATLRCSIGPSSAARRNGRTRRPAGPSQHHMCGGAATTNINKPNSIKLTDRYRFLLNRAEGKTNPEEKALLPQRWEVY